LISPIAPPAAPPARVPEEAEYAFFGETKRPLQVNFCKNPRCANYGVPPAIAVKYARRSKAGAAPGVDYKLHAHGSGLPGLICLLCKEYVPFKSNAGVVQELTRLSAQFAEQAPHCCPRPGCSNGTVPAPDAKAYYRFGRTEGGSVRYRCRACKKTFSEPSRATLRQREPRKNVPVLTSLMNKMPLSRITEAHGVSFQTVYDKLNFFAKQAEAFSARHERRLPEVVRGTKRYLAIDRQEYAVNWTHRKDKRNVVIRALGTADLETGFVYGMHINFDGGLDADVVEADAKSCGDYTTAMPFRRYGRLWLKPDYTRAVADSAARLATRIRSGLTLEEDILKAYEEAESRADVESPEMVAAHQRFPAAGMQVHAEYTMYAHFYYLHGLLSSAAKLRFYMDQESGIRAACLAAFEDEIRDRRADAFFVRLGKELSVDAKRKVVRESRETFAAECDANPELDEHKVKVLMMKLELASAAAIGKWSDRWAAHPFPNQAEPEKKVCYLTDFGDLDDDHKARLHLNASLHAIDRFFMSVRRRLNMLERPVATSSKAGRTWYGYSAYQPENIGKLLTVFRAYYNYRLKGRDGKTPAMRMGLTHAPVSPSELLGQ
jgi:transposase-like protein